MWHCDPDCGRGHVNWPRLRAEQDRVVAPRQSRAGADTADGRARRFTEHLDAAITATRPGENALQGATHAQAHVAELRRLIGILLDTLADWELTAEQR